MLLRAQGLLKHTHALETVLPEAFEQGGSVVGLSCLFGFLAALSLAASFPGCYDC